MASGFSCRIILFVTEHDYRKPLAMGETLNDLDTLVQRAHPR